MVEQVELNRLFWHSRRGMLELDVLLVPFVLGQLSRRWTAEWIASDIMAAEPVNRAAPSLVTAMARLPASAAKMTFFEVEAAMAPRD